MKENRQRNRTKTESVEEITEMIISGYNNIDNLFIMDENEEKMRQNMEEFDRFVDKMSEAYSMVGDIIENNEKYAALYTTHPSEISKNPELKDLFNKALAEAYQKKAEEETGQIPGQISLFPVVPEISSEDLLSTMASVGSHIYSISNRKYQHALDTKPNPHAYVAKVGQDFFENLSFNADGSAEFVTDPAAAGKISDAIKNGSGKHSEGPDKALFMAFFTALYKKENRRGDFRPDMVTVYIPSFCRDLNIRVNSSGTKETDNANDFWGNVRALKEYIGVMNRKKDGSAEYWKVVDIVSYNSTEKTLTFSTPYLAQVYSRIELDPSTKVTTKTGQLKYKKENYCKLWHSDIASERNKTAVEVVELIMRELLQRGGKPDCELKQNLHKVYANREEITVHLKISDIIKECPLLNSRLENTTGTSQHSINVSKNRKLKAAFSGAPEIMQKKTDAFEYWLGLKIKWQLPTVTGMDEYIEISHNGVNGKYKCF